MFNIIQYKRPVTFFDIRLFSVLLMLIITTSIQAKEVTQKFNGLTLNANLEMADGKGFKDGMVLIIHGYLAHNKMELIRTSQQALLDNDLSSLAINLSLGIDNRHGFYDCTWPHRHLQENAVKELSAWAGWLRDKGVSNITLLAHSRGANEAMVYVVEQKDAEVTHLVMLAPGAGENVKIMYQERYGNTFDKTLSLAYKQIAAGKGAELMHDIDLLACARTQVTANTFVSYYAEGNKFIRFKDYLPKISIPALVVTGTADDRQPNIVELLSPVIDSERTQISVVEGAGHFFRDLNMDEAMEALIEFIDE